MLRLYAQQNGTESGVQGQFVSIKAWMCSCQNSGNHLVVGADNDAQLREQ
jgi:hypothetical protein